MLPEDFVYLEDPRILLSMDYCGSHNFVGRPVRDYHKKVCILTRLAHESLLKVQDALEKFNPKFRLKIFDAYRPTTAVQHFKEWAKDHDDLTMKMLYYPHFTKKELFELGYIADRSSHSRGSTVDLTIVCDDIELNMGTHFDYFGELSHTDNLSIVGEARKNRELLKNLMQDAGFVNLPLEWWHYTLKDEPHPGTYFSFPIK